MLFFLLTDFYLNSLFTGICNFTRLAFRDVEAVIFQPLSHLSLPLPQKTTVDLSSTKIVIYYNQKVYPKIRKWQKRLKEGKIKANNQKDSEDK